MLPQRACPVPKYGAGNADPAIRPLLPPTQPALSFPLPSAKSPVRPPLPQSALGTSRKELDLTQERFALTEKRLVFPQKGLDLD